jgi:O-antigen/teichoic acid export membrane protein
MTMLAMLAFTTLTNIDVIFAKHYLAAIDASTYSAISVLGRIVFYAPGGIALAMFPRTSSSGDDCYRRQILLKAFLMSVAIISVICLVYALSPDIISRYVFSDKFNLTTIDLLIYSLGMSFLSLSYLFVIYLLSIDKTRITFLIAIVALLQIIMIYFFHDDISQMVNIMGICGFLSFLCVITYVITETRLVRKEII